MCAQEQVVVVVSLHVGDVKFIEHAGGGVLN